MNPIQWDTVPLSSLAKTSILVKPEPSKAWKANVNAISSKYILAVNPTYRKLTRISDWQNFLYNCYWLG